MTFAIIFILVFVVLAIFALYLSRRIEHGEARFGPDGKPISDRDSPPGQSVRPAGRIESADKTDDE